MMTSCRKYGSEKYSGGGGKELEKCCWKLKKLRLKLKIRVRHGLRKWNFKIRRYADQDQDTQIRSDT